MPKIHMPDKPDYKKFQAMLNEYCPDKPVTEAEAAEAFHNLAEFVSLLIRINDRLDLAPLRSDAPHDE